ncbi:PREDICTED: josephin-2 [Condylura cristata]|uniref:josephin-2 n=1 Tax=Condylura cristata TaxID=143302 RepID=UPI0006432581|nr:PREDICTED: josephin-2 [Condylura cristata]
MSQAPGAQPSPPPVYHERQRLELCAVHALNNVLQQQLFSQEAADEICKRWLDLRVDTCPQPSRAQPPHLLALARLAPQLAISLWGPRCPCPIRLPSPWRSQRRLVAKASPLPRAFLAAALAQGLCEVLLVVSKDVEEKGSWLRPD